ncbi:MAG TPA: hypothetical protein VFQ80_16735 [Thermomicrobiales bacterium]|nr:hypothetical protein [Thermomicrobiales bacterium]
MTITTNGSRPVALNDDDASAAAGEARPPQPLAADERFRDLIDHRTGPIGRVVGSEKEPAGSHAFSIWVTDDALALDAGHIVVAFSEEAAVVGVLDEARRYSDLQTFLDDYFDRMGEEEAASVAQATKRPEILVYTVNVLATKHRRDDVDSRRPPIAGPVWFATPAALDYALEVDQFQTAIPALLHTNGNAEWDDDGNEKKDELGRIVFQRSPIYLDAEYLLGQEAGHANWTGQSGLATKTSHALFLTSSAFQRMAAEGKTIAALMFNVKGPDLLWLDKPAQPEPELAEAYDAAGCPGLRQRDVEAYAAMGLEPKPFANFRIFAPFKAGQIPDSGATLDLDAVKDFGRLNTLRSKPTEARGVVHPIAWDLGPLLRMPHKVFEYGDLDDKMFGFLAEVRDRGIQTISQFDELAKEIDEYFATNSSASDWHSHHKFTFYKARNRIKNLPSKFDGLLAPGHVNHGQSPKADAPFSNQELRVIDIAGCNTNVQELLVTSIITRVWKMAETQTLGVDKVIVFVDELNKYAAAGGEGALRDTLVDIAARGRHLNVVLFGAQQFRSKVDDEILGNCGTSFYGRIGDEEIVNSAYRSLSDSVKRDLLGLKKGRMLVRHAHFRAPLFGAFPLPPTLPGMGGQRVFNGEASDPWRDAADGLWRTLQRLMGDRAPQQRVAHTACEGIEPEAIGRVMQQIVSYDWTRNSRSDPWRAAQAALARNRS